MVEIKENTETLKNKKELVRSDLNLEKWNLFGTQRNRGLRTLKREKTIVNGNRITQQVTIGLKGSNETLTTEEGKVFYMFLDMWEKNGKKPDGVIFSSINKILNELVSHKEGEEKKIVRRGNWSKAWFMKKIKKMISIPIVYEAAYENKDGSIRNIESFTLLSNATVFDRKLNVSQNYFDFSSFVIHPVIVKSILEKNIKPIRLDVIVKLKKEMSVIMYRYLDLIMADKVHYERDIHELAVSLDMGPTRPDNMIREMRETCLELEGKDLSTGRITYCKVERRVNGKGWKIVVKKGKQVSLIKRPSPIQSDEEQLALNKSLKEFFEGLGGDEQRQIKDDADRIFKEVYSSFGGDATREVALLDAIESYKSKVGSNG